ncbi:MAG: 50S ribosomal protein L28 [Candidatus Magasanikbacteria bacterium CG10_big_fil_rev_8_21_14_0_10_36_32]|uniref:50S ribosomal protein L28 n=1 Tax=Candidatus Magasanikbacteria bacterium CG10_big_fil_rev_8_21_14_0_10_36_32 TaxID=1974646 RepID=A0A2M6W679_9BACT|nr:MAG: 50S ribosomal protein L28 [Candidatus Magasanikbacteria bacterium CG10_big_fil_rev_8_21_14_0_10_36_32]
MSRTCAFCKKTASRANSVSHSNIKTPRFQKPNLQLISISGKRVKTCSSCRRTLNKKLHEKAS